MKLPYMRNWRSKFVYRLSLKKLRQKKTKKNRFNMAKNIEPNHFAFRLITFDCVTCFKVRKFLTCPTHLCVVYRDDKMFGSWSYQISVRESRSTPISATTEMFFSLLIRNGARSYRRKHSVLFKNLTKKKIT